MKKYILIVFGLLGVASFTKAQDEIILGPEPNEPAAFIERAVLDRFVEKIDYSLAARSAEIQGQVSLYVVADSAGNYMLHHLVDNPDPRLSKSVVDVLPQLKFSVGYPQFDAVVRWVRLKFEFRWPDKITVEILYQGTGLPPIYPAYNDFVAVDIKPIPTNYNEVKNKIGYPPMAKEAEIEGKVIVRFLIDKYGTMVKHVVVQDPHPILTNAVTRWIKELKFTPGSYQTEFITCWVNVVFDFYLLH